MKLPDSQRLISCEGMRCSGKGKGDTPHLPVSITQIFMTPDHNAVYCVVMCDGGMQAAAEGEYK